MVNPLTIEQIVVQTADVEEAPSSFDRSSTWSVATEDAEEPQEFNAIALRNFGDNNPQDAEWQVDQSHVDLSYEACYGQERPSFVYDPDEDRVVVPKMERIKKELGLSSRGRMLRGRRTFRGGPACGSRFEKKSLKAEFGGLDGEFQLPDIPAFIQGH